MHYELSWEAKGLLISYKGLITSRGVTDVVRQFQADERYDTLKYVIHDTSYCLGATYVSDELLELAATDGAAAVSTPDQRVAVVTDRPEVKAFTLQYLSAGLNRHEVRIFSTIAAARHWACERYWHDQ